MAGQTLNTNIVINANVNGFTEAGSTISQLGETINGLSQQLINFGKESVEVYRQYELSMADAEVALSTSYGKGSTQLKDVMNQLNAAATEWAATTIFHTDDVANAISKTAHAGWDLEEIMTGIPAAMELAAAGNMDLSEAVDYITKTTHAAGIEMEDMGHLIDVWTYAANSSASTVGEFGDAMLKMGSTMKFTANTEELMTLLAATANAGTVGEAAGTQLRNAIIRLIAPTDKAKKAMAELGIESEETAGLLEDESLQAASATLAAHGFSVFDEEGNLKSIIDIFRELYVALGDIAGGYENIEKNTDTLGILTKIFPTRNTTEALNILAGISTNFDDLYEKLLNGEAQGYGEYAMHTMMNTLNGDIETFESKYERLKQVVGEQLSGDVSTALSGLGGFIDSLAEMDPELMSALVSGLELLAGVGPGLVVTGAAVSFIGKMLVASGIGLSGAGWVLAAAGVGALAVSLNSLYESHYEDLFGENGLNSEMIQQHIGTISSEFKKANVQIDRFNRYVTECMTGYTTASKELNADLASILITGVTIQEGSDEYESLMTAGENMVDALKAGIQSKNAEIIEALAATRAASGDEESTIWQEMINVINAGYETALADAESLGKQLRDAMTAAFKDGHLTGEELAGIQSIMNELDRAAAMVQDRQFYVQKQEILRKARTLGLDTIRGTSETIQTERDAELEAKLNEQNKVYFDLEYRLNELIRTGGTYTDENGNEVVATEARRDAMLAKLRESNQEELYLWDSKWNSFLLSLYSEGVAESRLGQYWADAQLMGDAFSETGGVLTQAVSNQFKNGKDWNDIFFLTRYVGEMVDALGGADTLQEQAEYFRTHGETELADQFNQLLNTYNALIALTEGNESAGMAEAGDYSDVDAGQALKALLEGSGFTTEQLMAYISDTIGSGMNADWQTFFAGSDILGALNAKAQASGMTLTDWIYAALGIGEGEQEQMRIGEQQEALDFNERQIEALEGMGIDQTAAREYNEDLRAELEGAGETATEEPAEVELEVDDTAVQEYTPPTFTTTMEIVPGTGGSESSESSEDFNGGGTSRGFAEGGRATTASVFAEDGPEWAIPEEHSSRTASLLDAARKASGFTWEELIGMYGGLNADMKGSSRTLVYSPTIHAADANGLEAVLMNDKRRLEKLLRDREMRDEAEVYA